MSLLIASVVLIIMMTMVARWHLGSRHRQQPLTRSLRGDSKAAAASTGARSAAEERRRSDYGITAEADGPRPKITIEPLADFDWSNTPPVKLRPFKPTYYITMALQNSTPSDLILIDSDYLSRVTYRRTIMASHASTVLGALPVGHAAVRELYTYLLGTYLPTRFPRMFELIPTASSSSSATTTAFRNGPTNLSFPLQPPPDDPLEMLKIVGETVEDDMFLLLRDGEQEGEKKERAHRAVAFVCCHPSGFDPSEKLGRVLRAIHAPVPGYDRIGAGMERFFARLEAGRPVRRVNTHSRLFAPSGNHVHEGEEVEEDKRDERIDVEAARFRVEMQTLTRLPETGAILFSFKTFLYPLGEIKAEGLGPPARRCD
ncbi:hypothetical protein MMYC01_202524 [Madurella mycetomatis]|uniref:Uncharacterized protein n=1 Tax=Madurella mycetomatis TaxID=100816 RepID=A0A175W7D5_9PEZI|nr:hypothetical protein MMYC01_202524 [Madurella mycetomatis]